MFVRVKNVVGQVQKTPSQKKHQQGQTLSKLESKCPLLTTPYAVTRLNVKGVQMHDFLKQL